MSEPGTLTIHTDGGARGNPGPAAYAFVIQRAGAPAIEESACIGDATNNQAEYTALIQALERALQLGRAHRLLVHSDSELLVKQMNGEYRVKDEGLKPLYEKARRLASRFAAVTIRHVPRLQNAWADRLYNAALDQETKPKSNRSQPRPAKSAEREAVVRDEAVECLRAAAQAWARGNADDPKPELVWEQLWSVLEEQGLVRHQK
ncbi:MAG TPA: ribonuclease HI family protein [Gemmataceae bacterium]|nr:ribonuclease HI family protein [Gemmataceae bacterium]